MQNPWPDKRGFVLSLEARKVDAVKNHFPFRRWMFLILIALTIAQTTPLVSQTAESNEVHWTFTGPRSVAFDWRGPATTIRYGLRLPYDHTKTSKRPSPYPISSQGPFRTAALSHLKPNTEYHYSIGLGPDHTFRTPPSPGQSDFIIDAVGDIGSSLHYRGVTQVQDLIATRHPRFVLMLGDLTYGHPDGQPAVDRHFDDVMVWSQDSAYMPMWGNHEWDTPKDDDLRNYKGRFELPHQQRSHGAPRMGCCGKDWYWFDYGNVRFIAYPEPYDATTWTEWYRAADKLMQRADSDPALSFVVTFGHEPPFSSGYHEGNPQLRQVIAQLAARHHKFVLNLNGHSHDYERTHPVDGVVSLTVGTGGSMLEEANTPCLFRECPMPTWSAFRTMHFGIMELHFSPHAIEGQFICGPAGGGKNDLSCKPGSVVDSFLVGEREH